MKQRRAEILEGIGHLPHLEVPERFHELVLKFFGEQQ
jgi:pimeloyl-ACP methyl ester carboxylesterase